MCCSQDVYETFNILLRRKPKENNFKVGFEHHSTFVTRIHTYNYEMIFRRRQCFTEIESLLEKGSLHSNFIRVVLTSQRWNYRVDVFCSVTSIKMGKNRRAFIESSEHKSANISPPPPPSQKKKKHCKRMLIFGKQKLSSCLFQLNHQVP